MIYLNAEKVSKGYTDRQLLSDCSLSVNEGDKIGIIGANGTGKSTLLKILAGTLFPDSGSITRSKGVRVAYLPQNPIFDETENILIQVKKGIAAGLDEAESCLKPEADEYQCKTLLTKLGLPDFDTPVGQLSGGQKRRVALASALASKSEVLILDEPTNHIDSEMVDWLENYLARLRGALIMVTHDRYFLDRVVNRIVELDRGQIFSYPANYSQFLELKAQREDMLVATERKRQSLYRKELEWMHQGAKARGTKSRYRIERLEELENQKYTPDQNKLELSSLSSRLGKKIIELEDVCKGYGGQTLISHFSYNLLRGDRVGIIGPNGCGKSTLLKLITGEIPVDSGTISVGDTVKIGYFSQDSGEMDPSQTAIAYIRGAAQEIQTADGVLTATQMMEKFLFPSELQYTEISRLSGGERRRLFLLRILMDAPNVLLLDEPTNDLDIETLTILEEYLEGFSGAVIAVSHDRYFLDKVMDHVFVFAGGGELRHYLGGYSDYRCEAAKTSFTKEKKEAQKEKAARPKQEKLKFSFKEQREYDEIDRLISDLEQRLEDTQTEIARESSNYEKLQELTSKKDELETLLAEKMERWVYLNELAEKIEQQKQQK